MFSGSWLGILPPQRNECSKGRMFGSAIAFETVLLGAVSMLVLIVGITFMVAGSERTNSSVEFY